MSYSNNTSSAGQQQQKQKTATNQEARKTRASPEDKLGPLYKFTQDETVFIENILVELRSRISNDMGENTEILEKIVLAEQILGARLDPSDTVIGNSN